MTCTIIADQNLRLREKKRHLKGHLRPPQATSEALPTQSLISTLGVQVGLSSGTSHIYNRFIRPCGHVCFFSSQFLISDAIMAAITLIYSISRLLASAQK